MLFEIDEMYMRSDRILADNGIAEATVQAQVVLAAMSREEFVAVGGRLRFERLHETFPEATPLKARMDHQATNVVGVVDELPPDRADHFVAQARDQDVVRVIRSEQVGERLGQRFDGVVVVQGGLALVAEVLELEDVFGLAHPRGSDSDVSIHGPLTFPLR